MYLHSRLADALPQGKLICLLLPCPSPLRASLPLAAETQGAELTSKLKQTPTMTVPSINCHALCLLSVHFKGVAVFIFFPPLQWCISNSIFGVLLQAGWLQWERCRMSNNMAKIADARKTVEQLKLEVNIERMMVSQHIMEMLKFRNRFTLLNMAACLVF